MNEPILWGLIAEFKDLDGLLAATRRAREMGYRRLEAYSPFPNDDLAAALEMEGSWLPWLVLGGGFAGAAGAFALQYYASVLYYPLNVGGRPYFSWPAFIPVTFEAAILVAAFAALFGMLWLNGLPQPYHPVFNAPRFTLASQDRFFLAIAADDAHFDPDKTRRFLEDLEPEEVTEIKHSPEGG